MSAKTDTLSPIRCTKNRPDAPQTPITSESPKNARISFARIRRFFKDANLNRNMVRTLLVARRSNHGSERRGVYAPRLSGFSACRHADWANRAKHLDAVVGRVCHVNKAGSL